MCRWRMMAIILRGRRASRRGHSRQRIQMDTQYRASTETPAGTATIAARVLSVRKEGDFRMQRQGRNSVPYGLEHHGIKNTLSVGWNLATPALYEEIVRRREGMIAHDGPVVVRTGKYTGRSPKDKFIARSSPL